MILKYFGFVIFLICTTQSFGQYILDTPDGKRVKLDSNGTWVFIKDDGSRKTNKSIPKSSTAKYTSHFKKYELWYDPTQWVVDTTKKSVGITWDAYFYSTDFAIFGYCLDSRLSTPIEKLEAGIREQWQSAGEIKAFTSSKDTINNLPVIVYEMEYIQSSVTYFYKGIVYSDINGSFQFTVGTQKEIFETDKNKIQLLLKGVVKK